MQQASEKTLDQNEYRQSNFDVKQKPDKLLKIYIRKYSENKLAVAGLIYLILLISVAIAAPWLAPQSPEIQTLTDKLTPPGKEYWLGADKLGRDVLSRLLYGARVSLIVSFSAVAGQMIIGITVGAIAGYFGGVIDAFLMRMVEVLISFPTMFLLITLIAVLEPSLKILIIVFTLFGWMGTARIVRGEFLTLKTREFVLAAKTMGIRSYKIIFTHILPNAMGPIIVSATLHLGGVILSESALSYLGLGIQPPTPSWGNMLQDAQDFNVMLYSWWYPIIPGIMILLTVLAFNFVGDGFRDALDPKVHK